MTVKELKKVLQSVPDNYQVVLAGDSEGNHFSPLTDIIDCEYIPETDSFGYVKDKWTQKLEDEGCDPIWLSHDLNAVCLWHVQLILLDKQVEYGILYQKGKRNGSIIEQGISWF